MKSPIELIHSCYYISSLSSALLCSASFRVALLSFVLLRLHRFDSFCFVLLLIGFAWICLM